MRSTTDFKLTWTERSIQFTMKEIEITLPVDHVLFEYKSRGMDGLEALYHRSLRKLSWQFFSHKHLFNIGSFIVLKA